MTHLRNKLDLIKLVCWVWFLMHFDGKNRCFLVELIGVFDGSENEVFCYNCLVFYFV